MSIIYPVIFTATHDEKNTYLIYIPDLNGMTEGYGLGDAVNMARDYIGCTLYDKAEDQIPEPSSFADVRIEDSEFADAGESFVSLVDFDLEGYKKKMNKKAVRRNVSIPAWLNDAAENAHINVYRVLQEALMERLGVTE